MAGSSSARSVVRSQRAAGAGGVALVGGLASLGGTSAGAQPGVYKAVALSGAPAPGTPAGAVFGTSLNAPVIDASGRVAFGAQLKFGGTVTSTNDTGIWSDRTGALALVAREGGQAPGVPAGAVFSDLATPRVDARGRVAFGKLLKTTSPRHSSSGSTRASYSGRTWSTSRASRRPRACSGGASEPGTTTWAAWSTAGCPPRGGSTWPPCTTTRPCPACKRGDFARFVRDLLAVRYAGADKVVLVMDQPNIHSPASLYEAFGPDEAKRLAARLEVHHTPKHGSWLNMAEVEPSALARDLPERVGDAAAFARHVAAWERRRNDANVRADWQFTTADARVKLRKLYPTVDG